MIPKILQLHWFWNDWPPFGDQVVREWAAMLPGWEVMVMREIPEDFPEDLRPFLDEGRIPPANRADLVRNFTMWKYGGIYVDLDTRPIRPFDDGLLHRACFLPLCNGRDREVTPADGWIDSCILGSEPGHPFWRDVLENCRRPASWRNPAQWFCGYNTFAGYETRDDVDALPNLCQEVEDGSAVAKFAKGRDRAPATGRGYLKHYRANAMLALMLHWQSHLLAKTWEELYGVPAPEHI
jgi:hypothetical protein